jgi:hypothetical protein
VIETTAGRPAYTTIAPQQRAWLLALAATLQGALALHELAEGLDVMALVCGWSARPNSPFRADLLVEFDETARACRALSAELRGLPAPEASTRSTRKLAQGKL